MQFSLCHNYFCTLNVCVRACLFVNVCVLVCVYYMCEYVPMCIHTHTCACLCYSFRNLTQLQHVEGHRRPEGAEPEDSL